MKAKLFLAVLATFFSATTLHAQAIADAMRKDFESGGSSANHALWQDLFVHMRPDIYWRNNQPAFPIDGAWTADAFTVVQPIPGRGVLTNSALCQTLQFSQLNQTIPVADAQAVGSSMGTRFGSFSNFSQYAVTKNNPRATKATHYLYLVLLSHKCRVQGTTDWGLTNSAVVYAQNGPYTVWASPARQGNGFEVWSRVTGSVIPRLHGIFQGVNILFIGESDWVTHTAETRSSATIFPTSMIPLDSGYLGAGAYVWTASGPGVPGVIQNLNVILNPTNADLGASAPTINLPK